MRTENLRATVYLKEKGKEYKTMKKLITILLCGTLLLAAACTANPNKPEAAPEANAPESTPEPVPEPISEQIAGGWTVAEDFALSDGSKARFHNAFKELVGVNYEPIALLGTQVVAGMNYCYLAKSTVVVPDAPSTYVFVYMYEDLEGGVQILNITDVPIVPNDDGTASLPARPGTLMGGWAYDAAHAITDEIKAKLEKALDGLTGATYEPIANLGVQVVAGMNRCLLCKVTPVVPNPVSHYALVYVYEDLDGGASLKTVIDVSLDMQASAPVVDEPTDQPFSDASTEPAPGMLAGGWQVSYEPEMTEETKAVFAKALEELDGVDYVPVACLGTQVVAGTNYCFLTQATVVYPDAQPKFVLVYIYEDLEGNAQILNFADMPVIPNEYGTAEPIPAEETLEGGWAYAESYEITAEIRDKFGIALNSYGYIAVYDPVANLGTQVVAGLNRCLLVRFTERIPEALPQYKLMYVYEALDGSAEITGVIDFDLGDLCTYGA